MSDIIDVTPENWEDEVIGSDVPVLVDLWATWCGPCKIMHPILDEMATTLAGQIKFVKVNIDDNMEIAQKYGVRAVPTLFIVKDGEIVEQMVGAVNRSNLLAKLSPFIVDTENVENIE